MSQLSTQQRELMAQLLKQKGVKVTIEEKTLATAITIIPDQANRYEPYPLTDIQQSYLLGRNQHFLLGNVASHAYLEFDIEGLDIERYQQAWRKIISRHDMLRTLVYTNGMQQTLREVTEFNVIVHDFTELDASTTKQALMDLRNSLSHQILSTDKWPLFDIHVSKIDAIRQRIHWSFDAIISDVYSNFIFQEELYRCYHQPETELPLLELSFRDYVLALKQQERSEAHRQAERYWLERVKTLPAAPALPLRTDLVDIQQPYFKRLYYRLPVGQWQRIKQQAKVQGLTTTVVLLTLFVHVLKRWSRESRFTLNMTLFNRHPWHAQMDQIVGDFTATMLLAIEALADGEDSSFIARAKRIQMRFLDDLEQRSYSGMQVLQQWSRNSSGQQLVPIVFTSGLTVGDVSEQLDTNKKQLGEIFYSITQTPQVLLDHQVYEENGSLCIHWDHLPEAFPDGLLETMFNAYTRQLQHLSENIDLWRQCLDIDFPATQQQQRLHYNETTDEELFSSAASALYRPFNQQVKQQPDAIAVISGGRQLSYAELAQRAYQLKLELQSEGIQAGDHIAVVLPKGWQQVVAVLGILASGAVYVPIDPDTPVARLKRLLSEAGCGCAISMPQVDSQISWPAGIQRFLVSDASIINDDAALALWPMQQQVDDLAYIIFTSGSTGIPKGVMMDHQAVLNTLFDINQRFQIGPHDRVFGLSALNFDLSVYDIFGTLAAGATLVLPEAGHERDPQHWLQCLAQHPCTVWNSVPALLQMLLEALPADGRLVNLQTIMLSGDWIPLNLPVKVQQQCPQAQLFSLGGATEAAIWSIYYPLKHINGSWRSVPYGRPLANQQFYVLDKHYQTCPNFVTGRLYIGGVGLAQGYWGDAEMTQTRFIIRPQTGERLYYTGDLGCFHPAIGDEPAYIEFQGREDHQIKLGGHRIELGEIEAVLNEHPQVQQAIVSLVGDESLRGTAQQRLVAYIISNDSALDEGALHNYLSEQLPRYMLPTAYIALAAIPLSANGKLDRQALPQPDFQAQRKATYIAPENGLERKIQKVVCERLNIDEISVNENLFDLGASSLDVVAIHKNLEHTLQQGLSVLDLFERPTIRALAVYLEKQGESSTDLMQQARQKIQSRRQRRYKTVSEQGENA